MTKSLLAIVFVFHIFNSNATNPRFVSIAEASALSATLTSSLNIMSASCNGVCDGSANAMASGSTSPYTFAWSNLVTDTGTTSTITSLCAGSYTITITDAVGSSFVQPFSITSPSAILGNLTVTNATAGNNDGSITCSPSGGTSPYTFNWSFGAGTGSTVTNLAAGNYCVTISDVNGCTGVECATVSQAGGSGSTSIIITEVMYNPPESGTDSLEFIELYNAGSNTVNLNGFTFSQGVTHTFGNLSINASDYFVIAVDSSAFRNVFGRAADDEWTSGGLSNGGEDIILLDNNSTPLDTVDYDDNSPWPSGSGTGQPDGGGASIILCNLTANNNDGTNWSAATTSTNQTVNGRTVLASPGLANSCSQPITTVVTTTDESCSPGGDGTASVSVSGGLSPYSYLWSTGSMNSSVQNLNAGTYVVTVTDAIGATAVDTAIVSTGPQITVTLSVTNTSTPTSADGAITTTVMGGISPFFYIWSDGATTQNRNNLVAGSYSVTVSDIRGCSAVATGQVLSPNSIQLGIVTTDVSCHGDSTGAINLTVSGGTSPYTYNWSNGQSTASITGLKAGTYTVTVSDANQSDTIQSIVVNQPNPLTVTTVSSPATCIGCTNGSITATANGGTPAYTYVWSSGVIGNPATNLSAGTYCVTVSDQLGCTVSSCDTVIEPGALANLIISEIMYNPPESGTDSLEYIEFVNAGNIPVSLNGYSFGQGVNHTFGSEVLQAGEFFVIAVDSSAFRNVFGKSANAQWNSGGLSNGGEDITLVDNFGRTVDSVDYDNSSPWPTASSGGPSGGGSSIELIDSLLDNNVGANWQISSTLVPGATVNGTQIYGSPGNSNLVVNLEELESDNKISLYPNPTNEFIVIKGADNGARIQLFDQLGKLQLNDLIHSNEHQLNLNGIEAGIYFLKIEGRTNILKLVKH